MPDRNAPPAPGPTGEGATDRRKDDYSRFLGITTQELDLVGRHSPLFRRQARQFSESFYTYLTSRLETRRILERYEADGNRIDYLVERQVEKFIELLESPQADEAYAQRIEGIARRHQEYAIHPVWIIGGYLLYLEFLHPLLRETPPFRTGR